MSGACLSGSLLSLWYFSLFSMFLLLARLKPQEEGSQPCVGMWGQTSLPCAGLRHSLLLVSRLVFPGQLQFCMCVCPSREAMGSDMPKSGCKLAKVLSLLCTCGESRLGKENLVSLGSLCCLYYYYQCLRTAPLSAWSLCPQHRGGIIQCWALVAAETHSLELCGPGAHGPKALSVKERGWVSSTAKGAPVGASSPRCRWELRRGWEQAASMVVSACLLDNRNPESYISRANGRVLPLKLEDLGSYQGFGGDIYYHFILCCHAILTSSF